jgi:hypothetical protein
MGKRLGGLAVVLFLAAGLLSAGDAKSVDAEMRGVVEKAIKAHGGADKLVKLKAVRRQFKGEADINGNTVKFTVETVSRLPDRVRVKITFGGDNENILRVLAGDKGWQRVEGKTQELEKADLTDMRAASRQTYLCSLLPLLKDKAISLSPLGEVKVQGKAAVGVRASAKGQPDINLYFDKASGCVGQGAAGHQPVFRQGQRAAGENGTPRPGVQSAGDRPGNLLR